MRILFYNSDLSSFEINGLVILLIITMACSASFFAGYNCAEQTTINKIEVVDTVYVDLDTLQFSEENLLKMMKHYKILFPEVVLAQVKIETGNFTSPICKINNNYFGHKVFPRKWKGVQMPFKNREHLVFKNWVKSVEQYKLFQQANFTNKYYVEFIKRQGYAEDKGYANLINKIMEQENESN